MTEVTRHFTATTFVVHGNRVLLHLHPKQQLWLPPGGHIERDELPDDAAVREIEEETGLRLQLHSAPDARKMATRLGCQVVAQPAFVLVEDINPYHQHIDFIYFATIPDGAPSCQEDLPDWTESGFEWFAPDRLAQTGVPQNVREGALLAIAHFSGKPD
jgi:8-oxo-dGTP pyrophosphatase MutT (NUDIX family)